ncbi:hypothetical protein [Streptomyces sp. NPDC097619]|uniref:hypothetical protein n=1 Tax=Streptomyces sp. NPDC097619 TaxID=3157228 RepID=UPI0033326C96
MGTSVLAGADGGIQVVGNRLGRSGRACRLAKTEDLIHSAQLNPGLFAEYAEARRKWGMPFKKSISLRQIIERARS